MARLLLSLLGYRFDVELCRETDPEPDEGEQMHFYGSLDSTPIGFTPNDPTPYDVDFPDRS